MHGSGSAPSRNTSTPPIVLQWLLPGEALSCISPGENNVGVFGQAWYDGAGGGRIELMPRTRKGVRSRRSSTFGNLDVRVARGSLVTADLVPRKKADPEELTRAVARATEVLGDQDAALRWLGTPVAALDYATPVSVLGTPQGVSRVNDVLTQMEHGVW